jgi:hypothetical protein
VSDGKQVTVTVKAGSGYDVPWIVFNGAPEDIKQQIILTFGFGAHEALELTLAELVVQATLSFQSQFVVARDLGGKVLGHERLDEGQAATAAETRQQIAESVASPDEATPLDDPLLAEIAEAESKDELTNIWKRNQAAFKARADIRQAVAARRAELGV